jgi:hypothetical protein
MSYSQIRSYFKNEIASVYPDMQEWREALVFDNSENIPRSLLESRYHIELTTLTSTPATDIHTEDIGTVVLTLFKSGYNDPPGALDELLDKAQCIKVQLINPQNVETYKAANDGNIDAVELNSLSAGEIAVSNDNIVKVALEFSVRLFFGVTQP